MGTQELVRSLIEQHMEKQTEKRIKKLTEKAKIDPNIIWQARKKAQTTNSMEYNTITEAISTQNLCRRQLIIHEVCVLDLNRTSFSMATRGSFLGNFG